MATIEDILNLARARWAACIGHNWLINMGTARRGNNVNYLLGSVSWSGPGSLGAWALPGSLGVLSPDDD